MLCGENGADSLVQALILRSLIGEPDGIQVVRALDVVHAGERNVDHAIDVVIALLHFASQHPNHFKADAFKADTLAHRVASRE